MSANNMILVSEALEQEVIAFYLEPNTEASTFSKFNITKAIFKKLVAKYQVKKHTNEVKTMLRKKTCLERYGVEAATQNAVFIEKGNATKIKKYGSLENANRIRQEKIDNTKLKRYGDPNYNNRAKYKETCLDRFGFENPFQNSDVKKKCNTESAVNKANASRLKTFTTKYGVECVGQLTQSHQNYSYLYDGVYFDSSWELALWIYANDHNEEVIRMPCSIDFDHNGVIRTYTPDFKYNGQLIEIKGSQFIDDEGNLTNPYRDNTEIDKLKTELLVKYNIQLWSSAEIKPIMDYIANTYGKGYLKQFKK